jgi:hypothetical protein
MDIKTFITFCVLVLVIALPFILLYAHQKKREKNFLRELSGLSGPVDVKFLHHELWRNTYAIAIDNNLENLYYINRRKGDKALINFRDIDRCQTQVLNRTVKTNGSTSNITEKLDLVIALKNRQIPEKRLEFFDSEEFMTVDGEIPVIEKWEGLINSVIKRRI